MSTPHSAASQNVPLADNDFASDVEYYLTLQPRQLPSRYLYDALGSALFDAICELPWYRITRAELGLLERYGRTIFSHAGSVSRIVELGPGNGAKLKTLVETAAFNRNLLVRITRELGGTIDLDAFAHRVVWNEPESRVEMHLVSLRRQRVRVPAANVDFMMDEGETIWTESSYKYDSKGVVAVLEAAGFRALE